MASGTQPLLNQTESLSLALDDVNDKFNSIDTELSNAEKRLDKEFGHLMLTGTNDCFDNELRNPVKVQKRLKDAKDEITHIKQEVAELRKLQSEALSTVKSEFDKMLSSLSSLGNKVKISQETDEETFQNEQQLVNLIGHMSKAAQGPQSSTKPDSKDKVS